jgi:hypothetical protein
MRFVPLAFKSNPVSILTALNRYLSSALLPAGIERRINIDQIHAGILKGSQHIQIVTLDDFSSRSSRHTHLP